MFYRALMSFKKGFVRPSISQSLDSFLQGLFRFDKGLIVLNPKPLSPKP